MKRAALSALAVALVAPVAAPAAAQLAGMPVWNNPKGGTGVTISGDLGVPNQDGGNGTAYGGRASVGIGTLTLTAGVTTWKPENFNKSTTSFGGTAAFRLIGGSLVPLAINLQAGAATSNEITSGTATFYQSATVTGALGISVNVPTPGFNIEPYVSPGLRFHKLSNTPASLDDTDSNFGFTIGANVGLGLIGLHLAYDYEKYDNGAKVGIFGLGAHIGLRAPVGM